MNNFKGYEIEIGFNKDDRDAWDVVLIKGERSHFMTFSVSMTLSNVERDIYDEIDGLIEQEKKS